MSATLSSDLEELKRTVLHSAAILRLEEGASDGHLSQYVAEVPKSDKYLLLYSLIKLGLISGKAIFFVNDIDRCVRLLACFACLVLNVPCSSSCYRLRLFLEKFSIPSAVLNAELPANSRAHCLAQFNKVCAHCPSHHLCSKAVKLEFTCDHTRLRLLQGIFDYLIATDESLGPVDADEEPVGDEAAASAPSKKKAKGKKKKLDAEFGVARGVDFQGVSTVINVDMPLTPESYTHRAGRTARAGASGPYVVVVAPSMCLRCAMSMCCTQVWHCHSW